jgi:hypothetical protein
VDEPSGLEKYSRIAEALESLAVKSITIARKRFAVVVMATRL